jgi:hypothetical protein
MKEHKIYSLDQNVFVGSLSYDEETQKIQVSTSAPETLFIIREIITKESEALSTSPESTTDADSTQYSTSIDKGSFVRVSEKLPLFQLLLVEES